MTLNYRLFVLLMTFCSTDVFAQSETDMGVPSLSSKLDSVASAIGRTEAAAEKVLVSAYDNRQLLKDIADTLRSPVPIAPGAKRWIAPYLAQTGFSTLPDSLSILNIYFVNVGQEDTRLTVNFYKPNGEIDVWVNRTVCAYCRSDTSLPVLGGRFDGWAEVIADDNVIVTGIIETKICEEGDRCEVTLLPDTLASEFPIEWYPIEAQFGD